MKRTTDTQFAAAFAQALEGAASSRQGMAWNARLGEDSASLGETSVDKAFTVSLQLGGGLTGKVFLSLPAREASVLLAGSDGVVPGDLPAAWLDWVGDAARHLQNTLGDNFGVVTIGNCGLEEQSPGATLLTTVALQAPEGMHGTIFLWADADLHAGLARHVAQAAGVADGPSLHDAAPLHRVIDVPLAVTLRFGQRHLTLRELLELSTGSLVELDRQVEEPVDLMLGERIIARGEVVIVDGNYGMRVTEVVENVARRIRGTGGSLGGRA